MSNTDKLKKEFTIPPIPENANLINMPDEYYEFYRYLIDNYHGCKLELKIKIIEKTEEREYYDSRRS